MDFTAGNNHYRDHTPSLHVAMALPQNKLQNSNGQRGGGLVDDADGTAVLALSTVVLECEPRHNG